MSATTEQIHPLKDFNHPIDTSRTDQLMLVIQQWLWVGIPGGFVYGIPRVGKTFGVEYCASKLKTRTGGPIKFLYYSTQENPAKTNRTFWSFLLIAMERRLVRSHTAVQLYEQVLGYIDDVSRRNHERQVILCIDEAQDLTRKELQWLISLHNDLLHYGIRILVIQVGTPELKKRQTEFRLPEDGHIKGRFFCSDHCLKGFRTKSDLHSFLSIYDDDTSWKGFPAPSKQYFANSPLEGTRLCDYVSEFHNVWRSMLRPAGFEEWPSCYLIGAVRTFLADYICRIQSTDDVESCIAGAVRATGIVSGNRNP